MPPLSPLRVTADGPTASTFSARCCTDAETRGSADRRNSSEAGTRHCGDKLASMAGQSGVGSGAGACALAGRYADRAHKSPATAYRANFIGRKTRSNRVVPRGLSDGAHGSHACTRLTLYQESGWRWRRRWDSNPRYGFPYAALAKLCLQPLGHVSWQARVLYARGRWPLTRLRGRPCRCAPGPRQLPGGRGRRRCAGARSAWRS
jgi:hypothetical protein